ncbi:Bet1-like SNARE 1-1 [Zea mays]|uniref:Bet1-like SNARE 1-1 n=1 Tax=Zea mays TaxID=4577 RepID=A0A317Y1R5_MAIZE|nr:Bet1-like SNARE 1-1 [Zea mays]
MNSRRDFRSHRAALFDGIEEGGVRAPAYSSREIHEHENDQALDSLHDRNLNIPLETGKQRATVLSMLTGDIHEEVENHNRMLDRMGNDMDASRGFLSGTVDKFKMVFETKSSRRMATMVASFIAVFLLIYYLTK